MYKLPELLEELKLCTEGADKVRALIKMPGWKLINEYLEGRKNQYLQILKTERDLQKIYYAQAVVNVIESLICSMDVTIQQGDNADKEIKKKKKKK